MENKNESLGLSLNKKTMATISVVLIVILAFIGFLTQTLPRGEYQIINQDGHEAIVDGTYEVLEDYNMPIWKIILSPIL